MRGLTRTFLVLSALALPGVALAQGTLTGVVKDPSGAVLPGVSVEAASPVLIERVRTTTTDTSGQYRIVDLRGGTYTVTFTLPGFSTVKREGVQLAGETIVPVNAELRVGGVTETITVTGEAPTVDVQNTARQQVISRQVIDALPTGRNYSSFAGLLTGVTMDRPDSGGALGDPMATLSIHGSKPGDTRIMQNGVNTMTLQAGGDLGIAVPNPAMAAEVTIDTSGVSAEMSTGGVRINYIPRDGGNRFTGSAYVTFANDSMQTGNLSDDLKATGLTSTNSIKKIYDINPGFGGPIKKDKVWFFFTGRVNRADVYSANAFYNKNAFDPTKWTYEPDLSRPASNDSYWQDAQLRITSAITPKNKVAFTWDQQTRCSCPGYQNLDLPFGISSTTAPEASTNFRSPTQRLLHAEWSSPVTSKLLLEAVALHRSERWGFMHPTHSAAPDSISASQQAILESGALIPILNAGTGQFYRGAFVFYNNNWVPNFYYRAAMTYVTKGHQLKAGLTDVTGFLDMATYNFSPITYIVIPGAPITIIRETTWSKQAIHAKNDQHYDLGLFAQDRWTMHKLTVNLGLRFDGYNSGSPEQTVTGRTPLTPNRADIHFAKTTFNSWKDLTPRTGLVYDVFGNGKTAIKLTLNKYLATQTAGGSQGGIAGTPGINPVNRLVNSATRVWINGGDFTRPPNCDLTNPNANGDCLALDNPNFGANDPSTQYSQDSQFGWGKRQYNWEFSAGVQHELLPRVSIDVGYFRRAYGNFLVTDNLALSAAEYRQFSITAPTVAGLPTSGQAVTGLIDPVRIVGSQNLTTLSSDYGRQIDRWNGVDVTLNARLSGGVILFGGVNTGRTLTDNCDIVSKVPEASLTIPLGSATPVLTPIEFCHAQSPFLTTVKGNGTYILPRVDVLLSATYSSVPGPEVFARYTNTAGPGGAALSNGSQATNLIAPRSLYGDRLNQTDLRVGKVLRFNGSRTTVGVDINNLFNRSTVTRENATLGLVGNAYAFRQPIGIALARFIKVSAQFDF
jgi:hypothetical protein